jgi:radical SAM protein with 4Fe4S-binding SPASM domain
MTDAIISSSQSFDDLLYLRIFEGCNLHCKHCFIPSNPKRMSLEQIGSISSVLKNKIAPGSKILVQWHGGEPTLLGPDFMREALTLLQSQNAYQWSHGIQTNLTTYNSEWKDIYHDFFNSEVGVSWDPKIRLMRGGSEESANQRFESLFWTHFDQLITDELSPYLIVTGTKILFETYRNPATFFEFITSKGIQKAHIERLTKTGYARENWEAIGLSNAEYSTYMSRWYRAYLLWNASNPEKRIQLSPFDGLSMKVDELKQAQPSQGYGCWSGVCDTHFHTIDANGYKAGCTAVNSEIDNSQAKSQQVLWFGKMPNAFEKARAMRTAPCETCRFKPICNTGCLATDKMDASGECSGGYRLFETIERARLD